MNVKRNSLYGLIGFAVPTVVMLVAYPVLVHRLGTAEFGVYFLVTSTNSALAFLDLAISSAALKFVAEDIAKRDQKAAAETIVTSSAFYGGLGAFGALLIWFLSPWLVSLFSIEPTLQADAVKAFRLAAIQFPVFVLTMNLISIFKGMQRFDYSTFALSSLSVLTYGGAMAGVTLVGVGLVGVTAISVLANLIVLVISTLMGLSLCRSQSIVLSSVRPSLPTLRRMFGFGVAMSVHSLAAFFFSQAQRLLVGALIGPAAVTIYVLAITAVSKAHAVINAATEVVFPLSSAMAVDRMHLRRVYLRMLLGSAVMAILILLPLTVFAEPVLTVWVGADLARKAAPLMQISAAAYFFVALSPAPFHIVNGSGRPWFNVVFDLFNVVIAASMLAIFAWDGITLVEFVWAFAISNIANGLVFQISVEVLIWRRDLLKTKPSIFQTGLLKVRQDE